MDTETVKMIAVVVTIVVVFLIIAVAVFKLASAPLPSRAEICGTEETRGLINSVLCSVIPHEIWSGGTTT